MTFDEVKRKVEEEHSIASRYPMRMIFCHSLAQYGSVASWLNTSCALTLNLAKYCSSIDKHPRFVELAKEIKANSDKHILLLSVGEYLRMAIGRETASPEYAQFRNFWCEQYSVDSKTRVFMPVFAADELFSRVVGEVNERQQDFLWDIDNHEIDHYAVTVYSDKFVSTLMESGAVIGFQDWLLHWPEKLAAPNPVLVTARHKDCEKMFGKVSIDIVDNPYDYLCEKESVIKTISHSTAPDENWALLLNAAGQHSSVNEAILSALNLKSFDGVAIAHRWENLNDIEKWYIWIWYQINSPTDYVGAIIHKLKPTELHDMASHIANDIIQYEGNHEWIAQRKSIMQGVKNVVPSSKFFEFLDKKMPETALSLLTAQSQEERAFIVKTVSRWMRNNAIAEAVSTNTIKTIIETVQDIYPELAYYLETPNTKYGAFSDYFDWYKKSKLINQPTKFPIISTSLDILDSRYSILTKYDDSDCKALWVDGMGIEWLSLICALLDERNCDEFEYESNLVISRLPSETIFNQQWEQNRFEAIKRNRLDTLSHKGMPDDSDYFLCIAAQIKTVSKMVSEAIDLLRESEIVIITADHGSSRLAALAFHQTIGINAPIDATPMSHGRFCELSGVTTDADLLPNVVEKVIDGKHYLVVTDYEHYKQSGNVAGNNNDERSVAGEVHGGMTPEECIVPVIVIKRRQMPKPINFTFSGDEIVKKGGKAAIGVTFSETVLSLEAFVSDGDCCCVNNGGEWTLFFSGLQDASIEIVLTINGKLHPKKKQMSVTTDGIGKGKMGGLP